MCDKFDCRIIFKVLICLPCSKEPNYINGRSYFDKKKNESNLFILYQYLTHFHDFVEPSMYWIGVIFP